MPKAKSLAHGHMARKAFELLRQHPDGLTMAQMREMLDATAEKQEHFNRRVREIRKFNVLHRERRNGDWIYRLGPPKAQASDSGYISEKLRAAVFHAAHGRCQMCGRTIEEDGIKFQADHRIPTSWGGPTTVENLWALCEECNRGKRNFFASFNKEEMRKVLGFKSVHERIAQFLKLHINEPIPAYALQFVANAIEQQDDWHKRLRELRYPVIGLKIEVSKKRIGRGVQSFYTLKNWRNIPPNHKQLIREHERSIKQRNS